MSLAEQEAADKPQLEATPIYRCKDPECKAWVREEFLPADKACPLCKGPMLKSMKHLPPSGKPKKKAKRPAAKAAR
ncbi:cold-inducible protein YdjO-related protein [Gorillibacterium sp. sgz500922]|uniref:cold-inducible protein YdjO-related protein n=1 Tax=Gorillibacterium sp. sgz500922 TaxID=3446694 RepID=UPI003F671F61